MPSKAICLLHDSGVHRHAEIDNTCSSSSMPLIEQCSLTRIGRSLIGVWRANCLAQRTFRSCARALSIFGARNCAQILQVVQRTIYD